MYNLIKIKRSNISLLRTKYQLLLKPQPLLWARRAAVPWLEPMSLKTKLHKLGGQQSRPALIDNHVPRTQSGEASLHNYLAGTKAPSKKNQSGVLTSNHRNLVAKVNKYSHLLIRLRDDTKMSKKSEYHRADERAFLDERGSSGPLAPNGLNPATIVEKAVRERIIESYFYKEQCFGINEADVVDRVVEHVEFIGGIAGVTQKPTPFLCLAFKLLQLAPGDDVLDEYLNFGGEKFKYLRALAVFYVRLTRPDKDVYQRLEPFLEDRRKLKRKGRNGLTLTYMDAFVDDLLTKDRVCATTLWKMRKRDILEDLEVLEPRVSPLGNLEDLLEDDDDDDDDEREEMRNGENGGEGYESESASVRSVSRGSRSRTRSLRERSRSRSRSPRYRSDHDRMDIDRPGRDREEGETTP